MFQEVEVQNVRVESTVRLRRKNEDPAHSRPIKVVLNSVEGKVTLLKNAK